ncbi:MAG TPA: adenylate/guanylate cyclase domain-containing protein [Gallionellaceae bacterium]|nr:adenylate/guanylate cyclase domain-containing protein [Gallionellaceae bacterium]
MARASHNWRTIAAIAIGLALFFIALAAGQYFYTANEIYATTRQQLQSSADDAVASVLGVMVKAEIVPTQIDKASLKAKNYIVLSSDGHVEVVLSDDKSNLIPRGMLSEVVPPAGDFSTPKLFWTPSGDGWTVLIRKMQGGYVILAVSKDSDVSSPGAMLRKNANYFHSVDGTIQTNVSLLDNAVDYAIVDESNTVVAAAGYVPLRTNLPAVTAQLASLRRNTAILPLRRDVLSPRYGHVGVVIVWADLSKEQGVLDHEWRFLGVLAVVSWIIALSVALRYWSRSETTKRDLRSAFQNYLSPQVMEAILKDPAKVTLGGQRREVTILFSDIRSFTSLSESLPPQQLTHILQEYFDEMTAEVIANEGVVDKFIGDAIMAFWGAPIDQPDQADRAVRTAVNMIKRLKVLQEKWSNEGYPVIDIGVGINIGVATVGNFGSRQRFDYTIIGDAVNTASRIEGLTRQFESHIIISESTLKQLSIKVETRDLGTVAVKGKQELLRVYQVLT